MRRYLRENRILILVSLLVGALFCYPYLMRNFLGIEQDTFFHLSRIEGLSRSFSHGDFLPQIYPYKNNGYGYASPSFYCDLLLSIPALLYLAGLSLSFCYKFTVLSITFFTCFSCARMIQRITKNQAAAIIVSIAYVFCNYRISDVYVRGALGEVMAMIFLPVLLSGLYEILEARHSEQWPLLCIGLSGLVLSHNLTFLMGVVLMILFCLRYWKQIGREQWNVLLKASAFAFLLTAWFTLPMLEQLNSQEFYVGYYASSSDLAANAMPLRQYLQNFINFGQGGYALPAGQVMTLNPGIFLSIMPLLFLILPKATRKQHPFAYFSLILGLVFLVLPSDLFPWDSMTFLRVLQFPWRLLTLATILLCIPAAAVLQELPLLQKKAIRITLVILLLAEGTIHLISAAERTFGITSSTTWQDVLDGALIDPYYSAFYVRVELAGADYLPVGSPYFNQRSTALKAADGSDLSEAITKDGTTSSFTVSKQDAGQEIILPITWYKGYQVYEIVNGKKVKVDTAPSSERMVSFYAQHAGIYVCVYQPTLIRILSICTSAAAIAVLIFMEAEQHRYQK